MLTKDAIKRAGGTKELADALGIWPQSIYRWGKYVPPLRAYQVDELFPKGGEDTDDDQGGYIEP